MGFGWRAGVAAYYGIAVQALLVILLALSVARLAQLEQASMQKYALTQFALAQRDVLRGMLDEETGVRGYVATADVRYLGAYRRGAARVMRESGVIAAYRNVLSGDRSQWDAQAAALQRVFAREIALVRSGNRAKALALFPLEKSRFDRLRAIDSAIEVPSGNALAALYLATQRTYRRTIVIATALLAAVVVSLFAMFALTRFARGAHESANEDVLTGIANRRMALRVLRRMVSQKASPIGVLYIDLDGFKKVNDLHGHASGDAILVEVARRLKEHIRGTDTVARLGGDEFVCIIAPPVHEKRIARIAAEVHYALTRPYDVAGEPFVVGCSLGWTTAPNGARSPEELLLMADRAMYTAKAGGGGVHSTAPMYAGAG